MARVLVIEDNPANMELMTYLLRAFGHSVLEATDGRQGMRAAQESRPDLVICDLQLPLVDGYEIARTLKADASMRTVPLLAVTAYAMVDDRGKALAAGFDGYFAKPIDPAAFVEQVQAFLPAASRPARRLVLVTDDRAVNLELAQALLAGSGYEVETALSAAQALRLARERPPDLIVSDVVMDGGDGYGFIQDVKADPALAGIPFVFLTSTAVTDREKQKGLALGAAKYLVRPMEPELLLRELEECLKGSA
jgi:two-component system cell cycle response regulator